MKFRSLTLCYFIISGGLSCATQINTEPQLDYYKYTVSPTIVKAGKASNIVLNTSVHSTQDRFPVEVVISPGGPYLVSRLKLSQAAKQLLSDDQYIYASTFGNELLIIRLVTDQLEVVARFRLSKPISYMVKQQNFVYVAYSNGGIGAIDVSDINNIFQTASYDTGKDISLFTVSHNQAYIVHDKNKITRVELEPSKEKLNSGNPVQFDGTQVISDIKINDQLAYITGPEFGFAIVDFSNPKNPRILNKKQTSGTALEVKIVDNYAYVADGPRGLTVFDISDPNHIRWVGSNNKLGSVTSSGIIGDEIIVNNNQYRLASIKIDSPELPIVGSLYQPKSAILHITTQEKMVFAATKDSLLAIDFTIASQQQISNEGINLGGSRRAFIKDNTAYVADWFSGLHIYDISIPNHPRHLGNYKTPGSSKGVVVRGNYAYIGDDDHGLQIIDISNAQKPKRVSSILTAGLAYTMDLVGNLIYLADHRGGLHIIDVQDVNDPTLIGSYDTPGKSWAVKVVDNIAYVADDLSGLLVFDVSDPKHPTKIGEYNNGGYAEDVAIDNNKAYVTFFDKGLHILDIGQPQKPKLVGHVDVPGNARSVSLIGQYAYIAGWESGIQIVDISSPTSPKNIGAFDTDGSAWGVDVKDQYAYVWDWWGGIKVINIQDPSHPRLAGKYQSQGNIQNLSIKGDYLYTANGSRGVQVYDIRNPLNPIWTTGLDAPGTAYDIDIKNNIAFIAAGDSGVFAADISDPFYIRWLGHGETSGMAKKIQASKDYLYVTDSAKVLSILSADNPNSLIKVAQYPIKVNDFWLNDDKLYVAAQETGLEVYTTNGKNPLTLKNRIAFAQTLTLVSGNEHLLFAFEAATGIHIFQASQNTLHKLATIPLRENVTHIEANAKQLFVSIKNIGLQVYDINNPVSPTLMALYPATEKFTAFKIANNAVFFAGKNTISSTELLPETHVSMGKKGQISLSIPSTLPIGPYHLTLKDNKGNSQFMANAFHVKLSKPGNSKFTMDDFKKILKQKTQNSNK